MTLIRSLVFVTRSILLGPRVRSRVTTWFPALVAMAISAVLMCLSTSTTSAQCTNATTLVASNNAAWQPLVSSPPNTWTNNYPPPSVTGACAACPTLYTTSVCEGNRIPIYMCASNVYTISLCSSANTTWNSYLTITNTTTTAYVWDDNGCGGPLSTLTFNPGLSATYFIRISGPPPGCGLNTANCGTIQITCSPVPPPPPNDNPCTALALPVGTNCTYTPTGTTWATPTSGIGPPSCGTYPNNADVWYTAVVPASGNLAIETNQVGATNIAMSLYTTPACNAVAGSWTEVTCNADIAVGSPQPFIIRSGLVPGTTVYIRVWPEGNILNGGSFEICAYNPIVPTNDQPCSATPIVVDAACTTITSTTQNATPTTGTTFVPATPTCGNVAPLRDVWFTLTTPVVAPPSIGVIINIPSGSLTDAAMAVYTGTCNGTLTQVACSDPAGAALPTITLAPPAVPQGTTLYVRVWNKTAEFGSFAICAQPTSPPPNDDPCGAIALVPQYGCLFMGATSENATQTPAAPAGTLNVPGTNCGGIPFSDVWFTTVVPPNGQLILDTDDGVLNDAAMQVYRITSGSCGGNNLNLTQIGATGCSVGGSTNGTAMPVLSMLTGLVPGETLYIRVWRQSGPAGSFSICATRTNAPPGTCTYTLRMRDLAGDGWNGSSVSVNLYPGGVGPPIVTAYTIIGAGGYISFGANPGDVVQLVYNAVGGFQNQISYTLSSPSGGLMFASNTPPNTGIAYQFSVDNLCNNPPAPHEDCVGAVQVCSNATLNATPLNTGAVQDLNPSNRGCLITNERQGVWYSFYILTSGQLGFTVGPGNTDYDYGVWGPYVPNYTCPPGGPPIRCSWADGAALTGLNFTATDLTEGVFGDGWTRYLDVVAGQWYTLFLDNWYLTGAGFTLTWNLQGGASISCSVTPVELVDFVATPTPEGIQLDWMTGSERGFSHFVIERSIDGSAFTAIGRVNATGESSSLQAYRSLDTNPHRGKNHYRLKLMDLDGTTEYSKTVTAYHFASGSVLRIEPNPVSEVIGLGLTATDEGIRRYRIMDNTGRDIMAGSISVEAGANLISIPVRSLLAGSYLLVIEDDRGAVSSIRFMKD